MMNKENKTSNPFQDLYTKHSDLMVRADARELSLGNAGVFAVEYKKLTTVMEACASIVTCMYVDQMLTRLLDREFHPDADQLLAMRIGDEVCGKLDQLVLTAKQRLGLTKTGV